MRWITEYLKQKPSVQDLINHTQEPSALLLPGIKSAGAKLTKKHFSHCFNFPLDKLVNKIKANN
jgi:hypothetical protein